MNRRIALLSALAVTSLLSATADAAAPGADPSTLSSAAGPARGPWLVRAEGSLVDMRDNWLGIPQPEVGLTVGRAVTPRFSVELTGSARRVEDNQRRSWSAMAVGRGVLAANATGRHALTIAGGPFVQIGHPVHGTLPFAHAELAYVYRAPFGLTFLAGGGPNVALASSPYVTPPSTPCPTDGSSFCLDFGPDAEEIHAGDVTGLVRLAVGWQF
jgi:hypothetical protein